MLQAGDVLGEGGVAAPGEVHAEIGDSELSPRVGVFTPLVCRHGAGEEENVEANVTGWAPRLGNVGAQPLDDCAGGVVGCGEDRQPSIADRRARRNARSLIPPIQIGIGRCTGSGLIPAASRSCQRPW